LASLVKQIDGKIGENAELKSFVVVLTDDGPKTSETLKKLAMDASIKHVPLTMLGEPDGPPDYDLGKSADVTVLMWKGGKVKFNHAYKGDLTESDVQKIVNDIPKLLGD
jgi:predicted transcriptional regulator